MKSTLTYNDWKAVGERLFGPDMRKWRFVCPSCGHVQSAEDFRPFKDQGSTPNDAFFNCIGRFDGHMERDAFGEKDGGPCNYSGGGLFCINPITVKIDTVNGPQEVRAFAFDGEPVEEAA